MLYCKHILRKKPCRYGLVAIVHVSASCAVGHGFAYLPGHTKDHHTNGTNRRTAWPAGVMVGVCQCSPTI